MKNKLTIYTVADSFLPHIGGMEKVAQFSETKAGATITSHCGEHTLGILFYDK